MVKLVVGFPGSGKSYLAINEIYNILVNEDKKAKNIEVIYTNINGVKFDKFPESKVQFKKLNIELLYEYLKECYALYEKHKNEDNVDDYLIEFSKEKGFHNALIVFDECHDFFTPQDQVKIFWLTYHRHLYHEIILLTQNKSLINSKYRAIPEQFIEAQPRSKKISSTTLTYKSYASFAMRKADMFDKFSIKTKDEVFALYQSGNKSHQKSIIIRYIIIGVVALLFVIGYFWYILSSYGGEETLITDQSTTTTTQKPKRIDDNTIDTSEYFVISMLCDRQLGCIYNKVTYPHNYISKFLLSTESKRLYEKNLYFDFESRTRIYKQYISTSDSDLKRFFLVPKEEKRKTRFNDTTIETISDGVRL